MRIQVNGEFREVEAGTTVQELVAILKLRSERLAVELNNNVVRRADWEATILHEGGKVEIVHFVGGGFNANC
ncbi:MAG: sulfur carrier protein ThiS [Pyrinomonadaceae bacterium]|nr:sulfur carrier protein ThiS [Pyrinomonadaceae bacterium]